MSTQPAQPDFFEASDIEEIDAVAERYGVTSDGVFAAAEKVGHSYATVKAELERARDDRST
jgi:hypothetical protein